MSKGKARRPSKSAAKSSADSLGELVSKLSRAMGELIERRALSHLSRRLSASNSDLGPETITGAELTSHVLNSIAEGISDAWRAHVGKMKADDIALDFAPVATGNVSPGGSAVVDAANIIEEVAAIRGIDPEIWKERREEVFKLVEAELHDKLSDEIKGKVINSALLAFI